MRCIVQQLATRCSTVLWSSPARSTLPRSQVPGTATPPRPASSASRPVDPFLSAPSPPPAPSHGPVDGHLRGRRPPVVPGTDSPSKPGSRSRSPQLHRTHGAPSYAQQHAAHHTAAGQPAPVAWPGGPGRDAVEAMAQRVRGLTSDERDELLTRAVLEHQQLTQLVADLQARLMRQGALLAQLVPSTGAGPGAAPVAAVAGGAHSLHATFPPPSAHPPAPAVPVIVPPPHVAAPMPPGVVLGGEDVDVAASAEDVLRRPSPLPCSMPLPFLASVQPADPAAFRGRSCALRAPPGGASRGLWRCLRRPVRLRGGGHAQPAGRGRAAERHEQQRGGGDRLHAHGGEGRGG